MGGDCRGDISALHESAQIPILQVVQEFHGLGLRGLGIRRECQLDLITPGPVLVGGNQSQDFLTDGAGLGDGDDFRFRDLGALQRRNRDDLVAVLEQKSACFLASGSGQLDLLHDVHILDRCEEAEFGLLVFCGFLGGQQAGD